MINIKLSKIEFDLLRFLVDSDVFERLSYREEKYGYMIIEATEFIIDILQDQLISKLTEEGINMDCEINARGNQIEALINKISTGIVD
ncbi:MAG: hypothetical protein V4577_11415 [Bacteroidota bacterium]